MKFPRAADLTGLKFHRLTVLGRAPGTIEAKWFCRCDCGTEKLVRSGDLRSGSAKSCGCWKRELQMQAATKHGHSKRPEYQTWCNMIQRCHNSTDKSYQWYGARGISVCQRWRVSLSDFITDVGPRPSSLHTLDRIDNNGNYAPDNCRWATKREQSNNRRPPRHRGRTLTVNGVTKGICEWARECGLGIRTIEDRAKNGWPPEAAVYTRPMSQKDAGRLSHRGDLAAL